MPNIDSYLNGDIQSKENKVTTPLTTPHSANWTDVQYPPATELYNLQTTIKGRIDNLHPVGSTVCMSINTNPSIHYGGEWELIDKSFDYRVLNITEDNWVPTNSTLYTGDYFYNQNKVYLYDKTVAISISLMPNAAMTGDNTYTMGKLNLASYGLYPDLWFTRSNASTQGDGSQARICYDFYASGTITCYDALYAGATSTHRADKDVIVFSTRATLEPHQMPDTYCNKFVFKRIS